MNSRHALWVSTSTATRGGVASYIRTMQQTPLWRRWAIVHVASHRNGSPATRAVAFAVGTAAFLRELLLRRPSIVHLHTASNGSFARKSLLARLAHLARVPVVMHVHGGGFAHFYDRSPRLLRRYIRRTLERADALVALGEAWAATLRRIAPTGRIDVVASWTPDSR